MHFKGFYNIKIIKGCLFKTIAAARPNTGVPTGDILEGWPFPAGYRATVLDLENKVQLLVEIVDSFKLWTKQRDTKKTRPSTLALSWS